MTKVVITAAGKGTRLLPFTKEMPKEMMPIFSQGFTKNRVVLPLLQYIYEQLYSMNFRDYCFVVGREKRSIEDHFTPHETYLRELTGDYKIFITNFYKKLDNSHLIWINQNKPLGFGDAVRRAERYVGKEDFIVHAGDVTILSKSKHPITRLLLKKLNFPRIRNLPNRIQCEDNTGKIDLVYFNSREGYLRKLFTINKQIVVSGKINFFRNNYQMTNPDYVTKLENQSYAHFLLKVVCISLAFPPSKEQYNPHK